MFGTFYNNNPEVLKRDIYVVKVNKDGVLVSTDGNPSQIVNEAILFPNPGREYCIVMLGAPPPPPPDRADSPATGAARAFQTRRPLATLTGTGRTSTAAPQTARQERFALSLTLGP